jgi:hypothetical protein
MLEEDTCNACTSNKYGEFKVWKEIQELNEKTKPNNRLLQRKFE